VPTVPRLLEQVKLLSHCRYTDLDLQQIIAANTLVVHLVVRVISIATALVLNEGEPVQLARAEAVCG
jgi:hypothetical protein